MIGFVTTPETAPAVMSAVAAVFTERNSAAYWSPGAFLIHTGTHSGQMFIPFADETMDYPLRVDVTPRDFEETGQIIDLLGGLDARVDVDPAAIVDPAADEI
tara:strand:+ start:866 stop:1171 length:306 start_codon:yes stop_codon:yes gene_type:complete